MGTETTKVYRKVTQEELTELADTITSKCINRGHKQADKLSDEVRKLILQKGFLIEDEEQIK